MILTRFILLQLALSLLFLSVPSWAFEGCRGLPQDSHGLRIFGGKSMFLPKGLLSGHCVIKDSRSIPKIMKAAGYKYKGR